MSITAEVVLMWTAVTFYAIGGVLLTIGVVFKAPRLATISTWVIAAGLVPNVAAVAGRWIRVGHGPYLGFYEVVASYALISIIGYLMLVLWKPSLRALGIIIVPIAFLLLAGAMFSPKSELAITGTLASWWLTIHVAFAKLAYATLTASFVIAAVYLVRDRVKSGVLAEMFEKLPSQEVLDDLSFRFVSVGFIFLGIMIAAGAIWANQAWGRYWAWDPIETWSLISWLVYALYLHLRLTMGWRGRRAAWMAVAALPVIIFALIGVPLVYKSIHAAYLIGY